MRSLKPSEPRSRYPREPPLRQSLRLALLGCAFWIAIPATALADATRATGCPLQIGKLPVKTWIDRDEGALSIRFVPVNRNFAHCLRFDELAMVGPAGEKIVGRSSSSGWSSHIRMHRRSPGPAKYENAGTSQDGLGLGLGIAFPVGAQPSTSPLAFHFDRDHGLPVDRSGWLWSATIRDVCSETNLSLRIPVERLQSCSGN